MISKEEMSTKSRKTKGKQSWLYHKTDGRVNRKEKNNKIPIYFHICVPSFVKGY
jgi:hypothetical protein